ncbi:TIGR00375 family protein [Paenibacillus sp. UNCCL117]|uniref:endonuclease Q family protein n=1 Tax=unclassified Paenibacillus TaxID=185978 RepID=UPI0008830DCF|nr:MULTISPECIES: endonuclease Q family protein [unclassified Paenibacillus]SDC37820.1 TIGR00375 family protein [Paenibacillus sp. cl123]SFW14602.1 TIGR00375 family protein [Paenibacillus sp. UNCCL117]
MALNSYYADLHIHIGRTEAGEAVKISAANNLTFFGIAKEASQRKGMDIVGIIDCHSPGVQRDMLRYLDTGGMEELAGGGIRYHQSTVLLGCELEVRDPGMRPAHLIAYLPGIEDMRSFTDWLRRHMKNVQLSSQRLYVPARELQQEVIGRGGILVPAHIFTPHKSVYGSSCERMSELLDLDGIAAVELGLSADSEMAGWISELDRYTFLTNSDAHSLPKIGREYNKLRLAEPTFAELRRALNGEDGRKVLANYGLNPRLGKYHRTYCAACESILDEQGATVVERCLYCGSTKIVRGVMDRILSISDRERPFVPESRPPYVYQVPLEFIPGLGPKLLAALLERFGTEMDLLHRTSYEELAEAAGERIAGYLLAARQGTLELQTGGGGKYGKVGR